MNKRIFVGLMTAAFSLSGCVLWAQGGAAQAVRGAANRVQEKVEVSQDELTAGPKDEEEKVSPGKIDEDASKEFSTTDSGLKYRILRKTEGAKPKATDKVTVHYKGWLDDQSIFDSSYRRGETTSFPLNRVVKGWTEGLQLVGAGGMIELSIPYELAYGEAGRPPVIPPKAQLHFIVELIEIEE